MNGLLRLDCVGYGFGGLDSFSLINRGIAGELLEFFPFDYAQGQNEGEGSLFVAIPKF
jgi:hypothetical protein